MIVDSGATISITPDITDFLMLPVPIDGAILQGLAKELTIHSLGTIQWTLHNNVTFQVIAYYVPQATCHLLSPQHYLQHIASPSDSYLQSVPTEWNLS